MTETMRPLAFAGGMAADDDGDANDSGGLLTLFILSFAAALVPWFGQADPRIAIAFTLVSLAFPAAALRARAGGEGAPLREAAPDWQHFLSPPAPARPEPPAPPREIAVIGGGFSGTMLAVHLARAEGVRVTLIERREAPARGLAYGTASRDHLLNVPAGKMSAYPEDPGHFARWLEARGLGGPADFAPRRAYGDYLDQQLRRAHADALPRLKLVRGEAARLELDGPRPLVALADGRRFEADDVVLATGNPPPPALPVLAGLPAPLCRADPWQGGLAEGLGRDDLLLLVGTGLTMADTIFSLVEDGFEGRILAVSRRGLMPRVHAAAPPAGIAPVYAPGAPLSRRLAEVRARAADVGWRTAMDELRPLTPGLWRALDEAERARFLRHLRPWWDVHRHRIAPGPAARLDALVEAGRLEVLAGRIEEARPRHGRIILHIRPRGGGDPRRVEAARIVNCAGAESDLALTAEPLLGRLAAAGAIRPDAQRLGIDTAPDGRAIGADGRPTEHLHVLGPMARARLWEATAVPELRAEAAAMAALLAGVGAEA